MTAMRCKWFQEQGGRDPAPARPMVDSRWGDIDVLVPDYEDRWTAASDYKIIVWANDTMSPAAKDALMQHAARGGTVVVAAGAIRPSEAALTGLCPSGEIRAVRAALVGAWWSWGVRWCRNRSLSCSGCKPPPFRCAGDCCFRA